MIKVSGHIAALDECISAAEALIAETKAGAVAREARGLAVVLLFASYENLLVSLTRTLLERAMRLGVGNQRLQPGFRTFAIVNSAKSLRSISERKIFATGLPQLISLASLGGRSCTIDPDAFPSDGSFMRRSQIELWCSVFMVSNPEKILHRTWYKIDTVVSQRNAIAHGRETPQVVGRGYTEQEIVDLIRDWHSDWVDFLNHVELLASSRDFFRLPK